MFWIKVLAVAISTVLVLAQGLPTSVLRDSKASSAAIKSGNQDLVALRGEEEQGRLLRCRVKKITTITNDEQKGNRWLLRRTPFAVKVKGGGEEAGAMSLVAYCKVNQFLVPFSFLFFATG